MIDGQQNIDARVAILGSIRQHLRASIPYDTVHSETDTLDLVGQIPSRNGNGRARPTSEDQENNHKDASQSLMEIFQENLEAAGGHCIVAHGEPEITEAVTRIISDLQRTPLRARRIALSNAPALESLVSQTRIHVDEIVVTPSAAELFNYDVGITTAQAAIAETGTLVLESEAEKHRLVSLVPPVHIAILDSASICRTLGEALAAVGRDTQLSPTITFITGPSRTADIELTLAIGVHGPQELYVIINHASSGFIK
jgi:L-lactate dehydrogenase complex protein LldG